jgi:tetratricopeptide (TPR) repeat protein
MSEPQVLRLEAYRERRDLRLRLGASLHRADPQRAHLYQHLARVATLLSSDRAAIVWVDEYGPGMAHPFVVVDLLSDRPRRAFSLEVFRRAWEDGVPGVFETHGAPSFRGDGPAWSVAVALGSDGTRSWFLVSDAVAGVPPLTAPVRERLLFLAGECSAVVLHRDLDAGGAEDEDGVRRAPRFAGWPILQDIEGREDDEAESRRIALRFIVARLPRLLVDDDLTIPAERFREQADRARQEVVQDDFTKDAGPERALWYDLLDAYQDADMGRLGRALIALGAAVEARSHHFGAIEMYRTAYEIFAATADVDGAVDAARFSGRVFRRLARWDEAVRWYGVAREVAEAGGRADKVALSMSGAANVHRDRGNLPAARAVLLEAAPVAESSGASQARGNVYLGVAAVDHLAGALDDAVAWGWKAVEAFEGPEDADDRVVALATLGGILMDMGDLDAAGDAWTCVRALSPHEFYRLYAVDALGHLAALRGDGTAFAALSAEADAMEWAGGAPSARAEILLYRGLSHRALGDPDRARSYLQKAVAFAEEHGFSRTLFKAEAALDALEARGRSRAVPGNREPAVREPVRLGLRDLRTEVLVRSAP